MLLATSNGITAGASASGQLENAPMCSDRPDDVLYAIVHKQHVVELRGEFLVVGPHHCSRVSQYDDPIE